MAGLLSGKFEGEAEARGFWGGDIRWNGDYDGDADVDLDNGCGTAIYGARMKVDLQSTKHDIFSYFLIFTTRCMHACTHPPSSKR